MSQTVDTDALIERFAKRDIAGERPWQPPGKAGPFGVGFFLLGAGNPPLEVCVVPAALLPGLVLTASD